MYILVIDGNEAELNKTGLVLESQLPDAVINLFTGAGEALPFAENPSPDIAFIDLDTEKGDGIGTAEELRKICPDVNIIFTAKGRERAFEAIQARCSGYLIKPISGEAVRIELGNLRNPIGRIRREITVRTFGSFDVFVGDTLVTFRRELTKELLAYLVDRRGSAATRKEIAAVIFEDDAYTRATQAYLTQIIANLKKALAEAGIPELLVSSYNTYAVDTRLFVCDSYRYLDGDPEAADTFHGEYMNQYSWAEDRIYQFYE